MGQRLLSLICTGIPLYCAPLALAQTVFETENDGQASNNSLATAQQVLNTSFFVNTDPNVFGSLPTAIISGRSSASDIDFYAFSAPSGAAYFDIDLAAPSLDTYLALFDASGTLLADNDDSFAPDAGSATDRDAFVGSILLSGGNYFIAVASSGNFANATFTGLDPIELFRPDGGFGGFAFPGATPGDSSFLMSGAQSASQAYSLAITVVPAPGAVCLAAFASMIVSHRRRR